MRKFNWDYLYFKIAEKGYTISDYAQKKLGKSSSYLSYFKTRSKEPPRNQVVFMVKDLELNEDALWQIQEIEEPEIVEEVVEPENTEAVDMASMQIDASVLEGIKDELTKLQLVVMHLTFAINNAIETMDKANKTSPVERLLRVMLGDE